ncbi:MAG TPA: PEP-utilizing enzyme [Acidimicrobiia bacterium]|nr:PEP-utilizing enzyme [Acidimicrobiia bacterium]
MDYPHTPPGSQVINSSPLSLLDAGETTVDLVGGISAIVGCGDATSRLRDGQMITVDGSTGNIEPASTPQQHLSV